MKKILVLMLGLVASSASFAQTTVNTETPQSIQSQVYVTADHKLKLIIGAAPTTAKIELKDNEGHQLYSQYMALKSGLYQKFDISALANGTYQLTILADGQLLSKTFVVENVPATTRVNLEG